jgi:integrase/transposase
MARLPGEFGAETITRIYKGKSRSVIRAWWIDQTGTERTKEDRRWRKEAEGKRYAADQAKLVHGGVFIPDRRNATVAHAIQLWLTQCEERNRPPRRRMSGQYLRKCQWAARQFLLPHFGRLRLSDINAPLVERFAQRLVADGVCVATTARSLVSMLRCALDVAVKHVPPLLAFNPLRAAALDLPPKARIERQVPQDADMVAVLDSLAYRPPSQTEDLFNSLRVLIYLMAFGGLRENEAGALQWEDIDFDRWVIHVRHGLTEHEGLTDLPKTRAGIRDIDPLPVLYYELQDYRERTRAIMPTPNRKRSADRLLAANGLTGFVIRNRDARPLMPKVARDHWRKIKQRAGLSDKKFTLHMLRHYAGSVWIREPEMTLYKVSRMLGHSSVTLTEQYYLHELRERDEQRLAGIARISERLEARYRHFGLVMPAAKIPLLSPPPTPVSHYELPPLDKPIAELTFEEKRLRVAQLRKAGMQATEIAQTLDLGRRTVIRLFDEEGIEFVPLTPENSAERRAAARRLAVEEGLTCPEIARRLRLRLGTVEGWGSRDGWRNNLVRRVHRHVSRRAPRVQIG